MRKGLKNDAHSSNQMTIPNKHLLIIMSLRSILLTIFVALGVGGFAYYHYYQSQLPFVAIANYGPHASLEEAIEGVKKGLAAEGFEDKEDIRINVQDVGFDSTLIPKMLSLFKTHQPKVLIAVTTPVAQFSKHLHPEIPVVFTCITDPVEAGLITADHKPIDNVTGSSDQQSLSNMLAFAKTLMPHAHRVGLLYSTSEINDHALLKMMMKATEHANFELVAKPINHTRDVALAVQQLKDQVDFLYVGVSGPIQPALPTIAEEAQAIHLPVINANEAAVYEGLILASFGVNYTKVGEAAGRLAAGILEGKPIADLEPIYPKIDDHKAIVSSVQAEAFGITISDQIRNLVIVESNAQL